MKYLRNIGSLLFAALFTLSSQADIIKIGTLTNGVNLILTNAATLNELQIQNSGTNTSTYILYDNNSATSTNIVRPAFVYTVPTRATNTSVFTNTMGNLQTNNNVYLSRTSVTNAAATNEANRVYATTLATSASTTVTPDLVYAFGVGLQVLNTATNNTATYILRYNPLP